MNYAVIETGGKQYIAREGETIEVDRLPIDVGETVQWKDVLLLVDDSKVTVGTPTVSGASVKGTVVDQIKAPKILVFKYKTRERYRRKIGHRQRYTKVQIDKISVRQPRKKAEEPAEKKAASGRKTQGSKVADKAAKSKSSSSSAKKSSTASKRSTSGAKAKKSSS
jgi:large subunit ribosomal protein L21